MTQTVSEMVHLAKKTAEDPTATLTQINCLQINSYKIGQITFINSLFLQEGGQILVDAKDSHT